MPDSSNRIILATHTGTDLDGYASLVALRNLYPGAVMVLSETLQEPVREVLKRHAPQLPVIRPQDVRPEVIEKLIVADTQDLDRIGPWAQRLRPGARMIVYDHHPENAELRRRPNTELHLGDVGATCTLVTEELDQRGVKLGAADATLLLTGLYEDTGQLSFLSVTPRDFAAAHRLALWGAVAADAAELLQRLWDQRLTKIYEDMASSLRVVAWGNLSAGITRAEFPFFMPDIGMVANRLPAHGADAIFALASVTTKVFMIARALRSGVDVSVVARELGGGGHAEAASATLPDVSLDEAEEKLRKVLGAVGSPMKTAASLMSFPPIGLGTHQTMREAHNLMTRRRIGALVVWEGKKAVGLLDYQTVASALLHGMESEAIGPYVRSRLLTVAPETPLHQLRSALQSTGERVFVVEEGDKAIGVVTRRDIVHAVYEESLPRGEITKSKGQGGERILSHALREQLGAAAENHLREVGAQAEQFGIHLYLVGGCVRDLVLRKKPVDWDLVAVGDTRVFIKFLRDKGAKVKVHGRFHTAHVSYADGVHFDLATARTEAYSRPGSLPDVAPAGLEQDLFRRDFSINAMAMSLAPSDFGRLVDRFRGLEDIKHKRIRVLHSLSFIDDPTRAFRALRLAIRFGFEVTAYTLRLIERAVELKIFQDSEGSRLRREILLAFKEPEPLTVLRSFDAHGLFRACLSDYQLASAEEHIGTALNWLSWYRLQFGRELQNADTFLIGTLALGAQGQRSQQILTAFKLPEEEINRWQEFRTKALDLEEALRRAPALKTSKLFDKLSSVRHEILLTWAVLFPHRRELLIRCLTVWGQLKPAITGEDLHQIGISPGPEIGKWLAFLRNGLLDGNLPNEKAVLLKTVQELRAIGFARSSLKAPARIDP